MVLEGSPNALMNHQNRHLFSTSVDREFPVHRRVLTLVPALETVGGRWENSFMNLGPSTPIGRFDGHSVPELLTELSAGVRGRNSLLVEEWVAITAWADQNTIDCTEGAATLVDGVIDTGVPIAGEGAPLVSEFALMELIAVLERSPDSGR
ncbi:MAG TPA: hypothetical protein VNT31_01040, partial [Nocardioides sp.]|nr:hypothetical protein [Nocardioides sp.]